MGCLTFMASHTISARDFFFGFTSYGSNFWIGSVTQIPVFLLNACIGGGSNSIGMDWLSVSADNNNKIDISNGNYLGFHARDMFNNFGYGAQLTYMPQYSWFGLWVEGGYKYRQFRMNLDIEEQETNKYKVNAWYAGAGIRLTIKPLLDNKGWAPFIEYGTRFNSVFSPKAPFGGDSSQFGDGTSMRMGLGVRFLGDDISYNIAVNYSLPQYDYFNRNYTINGIKPYEHIKGGNNSVFLTIQIEH